MTTLQQPGSFSPGSRVNYNYLFAGEPQALQRFETWLLPQLDSVTQRWQNIQDGDSPLSAALTRAEQFMLLASLLGVVLARNSGCRVAAQRYAQRNYDAVGSDEKP